MTIQELAVAPGVHRFGDVVNWYLLDDTGDLTLVDAGWPRDWDRLEAAARAIGRSLDDLRAVVLTHAHVDHLGVAQTASDRLGAPVRVHADDVALARGEEDPPRPAGLLRHLWRPTTVAFLVRSLLRGGGGFRAVREPVPFHGEAPLDVPGHPVPVHTPGHTAGHCALHLPRRGVLFTGDALVTRDVLTGRIGPRLSPHPFNRDTEQALRSLARLEGLAADVVLPGHGPPHRASPAQAVARAREVVPSRR